MSHSKYEYVKQFETHATMLPHTWLVVRIDGRSFHRYACSPDNCGECCTVKSS
jgi:tRNA(His) guanylyltransferase